VAFATGKLALAKPGYGNPGRQPPHQGCAVTLVQGSPTRDGIVKILRDKDIERRLAELNRRLAASDAPEAAPGRVIALRNAAPAPT
jgi:hypothetical protein